MILRALQTLHQLTDDFEVVIINDGSRDDSALVLDEMARLYPQHVRIIHRTQPSGYGGVLRGGFAAGSKDWIFYTDGDAQYDPRELTVLAEAVAEGVDMVNRYKIKRHDPFHRVVIGLAYQYFVKLAFGLVIRDVDCDFRLMRRDIFDHVQLESTTGTTHVRNGEEDSRRGHATSLDKRSSVRHGHLCYCHPFPNSILHHQTKNNDPCEAAAMKLRPLISKIKKGR